MDGLPTRHVTYPGVIIIEDDPPDTVYLASWRPDSYLLRGGEDFAARILRSLRFEGITARTYGPKKIRATRAVSLLRIGVVAPPNVA